MKGLAILLALSIALFSNAGTAVAQAQPTTDPVEAAAVNTILARWNKPAPPSTWNTTGDLCSGWAIDNTDIEDWDFNPGIKCDCTYNNSKTCRIVKLRVYAIQVVGTFPNEVQYLQKLTYLNFDQNYLSGPIPAFLGNLTQLETLSIGYNAFEGPIPKELGKLKQLTLLGISVNYLNGSIPEEFGNLTSLQKWFMDSSGLSGKLPETLSNLKNLQLFVAGDSAFTGKIPDFIGSSWTGLTDLRILGSFSEGPIPANFANLVSLTNLRIGDLTNGSSSSLDFIRNMTSLNILILRNCKISDSLPNDFSQFKSLQKLDLSFNNITGQLPQSLFNLGNLIYLFLGNNSLTGSLPSEKSSSLLNIDLSYNQLSGSFPSWVKQDQLKSLQLNLVANNFIIDSSNSSVLPSGLNCLQRDIPCHKGNPIYYSFAIRCGGNTSLRSADQTVYEPDYADLLAASYFVSDATRWGVSNVGAFSEATNTSYKNQNLAQFQNTLDMQLFQNSRMSASSLRYYGLGLQNGNYTVKLQFAETGFPNPPPYRWEHLGRRIFDIYIQGALKEKNFNIRKEAGGKSFVAVVKDYTVPVTNNFLEIHLFWAGKGTCCIPTQGYYGPTISAVSAYPADFNPTVSNKEPGASKSKTGLIVGTVVAAVVLLGILAVLSILFWRNFNKKKDMEEELLGIVDRPFLFSYNELKSATDTFSASNILGEGGYGPVYKGILPDGRTVAVKQLAVTSLQGKRQFLTEVATISAVQHKNLVKLYGCCVEEKTPLLVYEYLVNRSLDLAIFGKSKLFLDWASRMEICVSVARGLAYLHEESAVRVIHRDIKASNILLDEDLNPKISDFGLAKLCDDKKTHMSTRVAGTIGYLAPEYAMRGHLTEKTDVFAFGVLALEIVAGRANADPHLPPNQVYLLDWAWSLYEKNHALELLDPKITSFDEGEVLRVIAISLLCTQASLLQRPSMSHIVSMLTGNMELTEVTSRPSYLTEWQWRDLESSNISSNEVPENTGTAPTTTSNSYSSMLKDSIIQAGR